MEPHSSQRPVPTPRAKPSRSWPESCQDQALALQQLLAISDRDWHALKAQRSRRAAEQLAAALVLLISGDDPGSTQPSPARVQAIELVEHALRWLKAEVSDPGCPSHGPGTTARPSDG
jgi:hypothetical protein